MPAKVTAEVGPGRVLQYRETLSREAWLGVQSGADYEAAMAAMEWRDVPTVSEQEPQR